MANEHSIGTDEDVVRRFVRRYAGDDRRGRASVSELFFRCLYEGRPSKPEAIILAGALIQACARQTYLAEDPWVGWSAFKPPLPASRGDLEAILSRTLEYVRE